MQTRSMLALLALPALTAGYFWIQHGAEPSRPLDHGDKPSLLWQASSEPSASSALLRPIPVTVELDERKVRLGERLFHDPRLSRDRTIACASCHDLAKGGTDGLPISVGIRGQRTTLNAPTIFNSGFNAVQFWDGRAASLEEQVDGPLQHPAEMDMSWEEAIARIEEDPDYRRQFGELDPRGVTPDAVRDAIATYERSLITPDAPFDRYLRGQADAISERAQAGYRLFRSSGCGSCHQGINVGGNLFAKFGVVLPRFKDIGSFKNSDLGRFNVTGREEDRFVFKVPSLRNAALTAPYFHDGSVQSLPEAVRLMARHQLGRELPDAELLLVVEFLESLTGRLESQ
jgi:cytochrome c peroxidase